MKKSNHMAIRALLRDCEDGMTPGQICRALGRGRDHSVITRSLSTMPDAYIDRWTRVRGQYGAVWCVVVPPANCPRPDVAEIRFGPAPVQTKWVTP